MHIMCACVRVYSQHVLLILYIYLVIHVHLWEFSCCFQTVDCCKDSVADLDFSSQFTLCVDRDCVIYALIGYFDTVFDAQRENSTKVIIFKTLDLKVRAKLCHHVCFTHSDQRAQEEARR